MARTTGIWKFPIMISLLSSAVPEMHVLCAVRHCRGVQCSTARRGSSVGGKFQGALRKVPLGKPRSRGDSELRGVTAVTHWGSCVAGTLRGHVPHLLQLACARCNKFGHFWLTLEFLGIPGFFLFWNFFFFLFLFLQLCDVLT